MIRSLERIDLIPGARRANAGSDQRSQQQDERSGELAQGPQTGERASPQSGDKRAGEPR